jgi:hypothetical protein
MVVAFVTIDAAPHPLPLPMKKLLLALLACTCTLVSAYAQASTTPSDESLKELLQLSGSEKLVSDMQQRMKGVFANSIKQTLASQGASAEQVAMMDKMEQKMSTLLAEEMSWSKMEAAYLQVYKESFTQDEINQLIAFYKSPTGQMFVQKMPTVMQKSMLAMQQQMAPLMGKIKAIQMEAIAEAKAAEMPSPAK